jgi:hypothetical protein
MHFTRRNIVLGILYLEYCNWNIVLGILYLEYCTWNIKLHMRMLSTQYLNRYQSGLGMIINCRKKKRNALKAKYK